MSNDIRIKRRASGSPGAPSSLKNAELAYNEVDDSLYYGKGTGGAGGTATTVIPIAGPGAFVDRTSDQSIAGNKSFTASPIIPTPTAGDSSTKAASTAFVQNAVALTAKPANTVLAGPTTGADAIPTYRALVANDIPSLTAAKISDFNTAADARITLQKGAANGLATLGADQKIPSTQLPSYVDDVLEYANLAAFPATGETGKIYTALDSNKIYRWSGSVYIEISGSPGSTDAVPEGSTNLYFTTARVLATALTGFSAATNSPITSTDTVLTAPGKAQAQLNVRLITTNNLSDLTAPATARTNLGLGTMAVQNSNLVSITGGTIDGITLDGGTF